MAQDLRETSKSSKQAFPKIKFESTNQAKHSDSKSNTGNQIFHLPKSKNSRNIPNSRIIQTLSHEYGTNEKLSPIMGKLDFK